MYEKEENECGEAFGDVILGKVTAKRELRAKTFSLFVRLCDEVLVNERTVHCVFKNNVYERKSYHLVILHV